MEIVIDVSEQELIKFGKNFIKKKIQDYIENITLLENLEEVSRVLNDTFTYREYEDILEKVREDSWKEYKKDLDIDFESCN